MPKIETKACGKITVGIPGQSHGEPDRYYDQCPVGSVAFSNGNAVIGILEATELSCR